MKTFQEAFGVEFGEQVQGSGVRLSLRKLNPNLKGRALTIEVFDEAMMPITSVKVGTSAIYFDQADDYYERFIEHFAWSVNARWRLWKIKKRWGNAYFPFAGFSETIRQKAIPKIGRPLEPGQTFYITFTDEHGESATVRAVFEVPAGGRAMIGRKSAIAEVYYLCY